MRRSFSKRLQIFSQIKKQSCSLPKFIITNESHGASNYESWTTLAEEVLAQEAADDAELVTTEFSPMLSQSAKPNAYTLVQLVRVCTSQGWYLHGQQLHSYILRSGYISDVFIPTALISFYIECDSLSNAHKLFNESSKPSVVAWNSLISGYVKYGQFCKALCLFLQLDSSEISADAFSLSSALGACGQLGLSQLGQLIHSKTMKLGLQLSTVVFNCLIDMYGKCGFIQDANQLFDEMTNKDTISWNSVIAASARNGNLEKAYNLLQQMPKPDTISYNELINGFAQHGNVKEAIKILSSMPNPNSSSWNSIITGYVNRDQGREALDFFAKMHSKGIEMDQFTFSSILCGVAGLSALRWGMTIHCCTLKCGLETSIVIGSALIDMYSKCGQVNSAELIFHLLPKRNLITWNALISGFGHNGKFTEVINLFEKLKKSKHAKPNGITFLSVLSACSHNQMPLEATFQYFDSMIHDYGIQPTSGHCCSMIRIMGQKGELYRGGRMIYDLGFGSCGLVWRALLGACGNCRDLKVAKIVAAKVFELGDDDDYVYVMMSNIYASYGQWRDVKVVREIMKKKGVRKEAGCSWIEVEN